MKRRLALLLCGIVTATTIASTGSITASAAPKYTLYNGAQAEVNFGQEGVEKVTDGDVTYLAGFEKGDYIKYNNINFDKGVASFSIVAKTTDNATIGVKLDSVDSANIATIKLTNSNGEFKTFTDKLVSKNVDLSGEHTVYFVGSYGSVDIDSVKANPGDGSTTPTTTTATGVYNRTEAESATKTNARKANINSGSELALMKNNYAAFEGVDLSKGLSSISVQAHASNSASTLEVRVDGNDADHAVATITVPAGTTATGIATSIKGVSAGTHDIYFVNTGDSAIGFDAWQAKVAMPTATPSVTPTPTPVVTPTPTPVVTPVVTTGDKYEAENGTLKNVTASSEGNTSFVALSGPSANTSFSNVALDGVTSVTLTYRASKDSRLTFALDRFNGKTRLVDATISSTNGEWKTETFDVAANAEGSHSIFVVAMSGAVDVDSFVLNNGAAVTPTPVVTPTPTPVVTPTPTPVVTPTPTSTPVDGVYAYDWNEAQTATKTTGRKSVNTATGKTELALMTGGYVLFKDVDFSKGLASVTLRARGNNATLAVRIDGMEEANQLGEAKFKSDASVGQTTIKFNTDLTGKHDLYFVVTGSSAVGFESWKCMGSPSVVVTPTPTPVVTPTPTPVVTPTPTPVVTPVVTTGDKYEAENGTLKNVTASSEGNTSFVALSGPSANTSFSNVTLDGVTSVTLTYRASKDSHLTFALDRFNGKTRLVDANVSSTNGQWKTETFDVAASAEGSHSIFVVAMSGAVDVDSFVLNNGAVVTPTPTPVVTPTPTPVVTPTPTPVVTPVDGVNPYVKNEAESATKTTGRKANNNDASGSYEVALMNDNYVLVKDVDFSQGLASIAVDLRGTKGATTLDIRIDGNTSANKVANVKVNGTSEIKTYTAKIKSDLTGKHDIYFVNAGSNPVGFDSWTATPASGAVVTPTPTPVVTPTPTPVVTPTPSTSVDPFKLTQFENATTIGLASAKTEGDVSYVTLDTKNSFVEFKNAQFKGTGVSIALTYRTSGMAIVDLKDGKFNGQQIAQLKLSNTNGAWKTQIINVNQAIAGSHDIYFVGVSGSADLDAFQCKPLGSVTPTPTPVVTPTPTPVVTPTPTPVVTPTPTPVVSTKLTSDVQINSWGTGYVVNIAVNNNTSSSVNGWKVKLKKSQVKIDSAWCVQVSSEGDYYVLTPESWNSTIGSNQGVNFGFQGTGAIGSSIDVIVE